MSQPKDNIFVGLDIGTTKICTVVARENMENTLDIIGLGSSRSLGIRKGVVVNIDSTVTSINEAITMAERMSGITIKSVCAGISGGHIESFNSRGVVAVKNGEVGKQDMVRVLESASAVNIPVGYDVLDVIPQQFTLDGQSEIKDPMGMSGVRLEVDVHIVTGAITSAMNITKSCSKAGISVEHIYLEQIASSEAVLTDDEREIGVCLIDGGGGTTDMAVFNKGEVCHTAALQIGGNNFTRDLTAGLATSELEAEKLKLTSGCVMMDIVDPSETISVPSVGGRPPRSVSKAVISQILQMRCEEIFELFLGELQKKKLLNTLGAGIVITGGMANFEGIEELATKIFGINVRIGKPLNIAGLVDQVEDPIYSTAVGLAKLHSKYGHSKNMISQGSEEGVFGNIYGKMRDWLKEFF